MLSKKLLVSTLLLGLTAACGDDGGDDEACEGHLCGGDVALTDPEGGNIIFEYIYFDTDLATAFQLPAGIKTVNRVMAYFLNSHDPQANPGPEPGKCFNLIANKGWPMYIAPGTQELDVGDVTIVGKNEAGIEVSTTLPKMTGAKDSIGRAHAGTFYQTILPNVGAHIATNEPYTVKFSGAGEIGATEFPNAIFMAEDFQVMSPGHEDNGPINSAQDFTVSWTPVSSSRLPAGDTVLGVTWLVDPTGSPTHMCPTLHAAGSFTIPAASLQEYKAIAAARGLPSNQVVLLRNAIVHKLQRLPNGAGNKRRVDMLSVMCWAQAMGIN